LYFIDSNHQNQNQKQKQKSKKSNYHGRIFDFASKMFAVVLVASLWTVIAQPLSSSQHSALMNVYNGFGSFLSNHNPV
jgi:hypothetical protein